MEWSCGVRKAVNGGGGVEVEPEPHVQRKKQFKTHFTLPHMDMNSHHQQIVRSPRAPYLSFAFLWVENAYKIPKIPEWNWDSPCFLVWQCIWYLQSLAVLFPKYCVYKVMKIWILLEIPRQNIMDQGIIYYYK